MRVLVTGGAGYVGSHTVKELAKRGHDVVTYDNLTTGHRDFVRWGPLVEGDIRDTEKLKGALEEFSIEAVLHFAASAYVGDSMRAPGFYFRNNVEGTLSVLEAMRDIGVQRIIVSSTCAVYGQPPVKSIVEDAIPAPVNPYGASKLFMERMCRDFEAAHGIKSIALRYFNACGGDPEGEIGERHDPEPHLIPRVLMAIRGRIPALEVYGNDYDTPDGTCVRDYIHVSDLAEAHVLALDRLTAGYPSDVFNLGTGSGHSVLEIMEATRGITNRPVPHRFVARRPGDPAYLVANAGKANAELGWSAGRSDLATIIDTAWRWYQKDSA